MAMTTVIIIFIYLLILHTYGVFHVGDINIRYVIVATRVMRGIFCSAQPTSLHRLCVPVYADSRTN